MCIDSTKWAVVSWDQVTGITVWKCEKCNELRKSGVEEIKVGQVNPTQ